MNKIPFLDLVGLHEELKDELTGVFQKAVGTAGFVGGPMVEEFERAFAAYCTTEYCVGVGSGTDALRFALMAAGVGPGDVVLTVPNTFIATVEAITQTGARPDFIDIDERTYNMDVRKLAEYLAIQRVKAIVPVHLYGQTADMDPILDLAERYGVVVIEDACQAHGSEYRGRKAGSMGLAGAFSFYPGKNLGACGEAGAVTTNDAALAQKIRMLRDHGQARKYYHDVEGYNGRLDAIQAGILTVKLRHLPEWTAARREAAQRYRKLFAAAGAAELAPFEPDWAKAVYHLYVVRVPDREGFMRQMGEAGIGTAIHYPVPLHLQKAYERLGYGVGSFPVAERTAKEIVSLPMFPALSAEQQGRVVECTMGILAEEHAPVASR